MTTLGSAIRETRILRGLSQVELAERLAVTQSTISFWENAVETPTFEHFIKLTRLWPELACHADQYGLDLAPGTDPNHALGYSQPIAQPHELDRLTDRLMLALALLTDLEDSYGWDRQTVQARKTVRSSRRLVASALQLATQAGSGYETDMIEVVQEILG